MSLLSILAYILLFYVGVTTALFAAAHFTAPPNGAPTSAALQQPHQAFCFWARILASIGALCLCASYGVVASICLRLVGYGGLAQWTTARSFKYAMWLVTGVWFDIGKEGGEWLKIRPAVFMGNHQTELDVLMLATVWPQYCSVTAKKSLKWVPFLGQFMALSKTVFIDRKNRSGSIAVFDSAVKEMHRSRQSVYIFPEGTRSYAIEPKLLPFKKGAFHLAIQAQVPIVPAVVANYSNILNFKRKIFRAGRIPIKVLKPFETKGLTGADVDTLMADVREAMLKEIIALSNEQGIGLKNETNGGAVASGVDTGKIANGS
ncbi:putative 1-acylglycerol-3-phosphate acyltransferase [Rhizodiscina lignyota]|uniref:1-acyl-sn-glycerol-3-phosphate acyltransferase n=1 Tax=Rhizodiscina lignyota TaxID=1504668 RepID=A0A9P4IMC9_9PEZI|nr:putative 1-acylglycerol-3-phosphate acyltransferase [Rhizodiscina lignyota]